MLLKNNEIVSDAPPKGANQHLLEWLEVTNIDHQTGQISFSLASAEHSQDLAQSRSTNFTIAMKPGIW